MYSFIAHVDHSPGLIIRRLKKTSLPVGLFTIWCHFFQL